MNRPDWQEFIEKITFGFIPAGTGNGLVKSISSLSSNECSIETAAYSISKGRKLKIDLTELDLEYQPDKKLYMFLILAWAYISDCDINSETLRWAGSARFDMWGAYRLMAIKEYAGSFSMKGEKVTQNKSSLLK